MISFIRKYVTSLPVLILLGLVLVAFVVTGVGDPFSGGAGGGNLARVGKSNVTEAEFLQSFDRIVARARETNPGLTPQQVVAEGGAEQVLDGLTGQRALDEFGAANGIAVSERAVDGAIASIDAFRLAGKFDQGTYQRLLAQRRMSERELRDGLRSELLAKQMLTPVSAGAQVPRELTLPYARLLLDMHEGEGAIIPPPVVAPPTAAAVAAYYKANTRRFLAGEKRSFRYALLDSAGLGAAAPVTDAEIAAYYDKNRETYGGVEQRRLQQVVLPDAAKAAAFVAAVRGGESFVAAAQRLAGASATDTALGLLTRDKYVAASNAALGEQVFAAPAGAMIGPVKTDFGFNVVRVEAVVPASGKPLSALREEIAAKLRADKGEAKLSEVIADIEDGFGSGESFADVVKEHALAAVTVPPVTRDTVVGLPVGAQPVVAKAFDVDVSDGPSVQELGKGQFAVLEVAQVVPAAAPPLASIEPRVAAALTAELRTKAAKQLADGVIADVAKGTSFAAALASRKLPPPQPIRGRRVDAGDSARVPAPLAAFLTMQPGGTRAILANDGGYALVHLARIVPGDVATAPPVLAATRQQLAQMAPAELTAAFGRAVERQVGIKINAAAFGAAKRRIVGDATPTK